MAKEKILIAVKTYPTISEKYKELACTAGFRQDGSWIRLYPISFRLLEKDKRYKKYQWIEADISRNNGDPRPESDLPPEFEQFKSRKYQVIAVGSGDPVCKPRSGFPQVPGTECFAANSLGV